MIPGPNYLKCCPNCGTYVNQHSATSHNTFGGTWWSDGHVEGPMYCNFPDIIRCSHCSTLFRLSQQKPVDIDRYDHMTGESQKDNNHPGWKQARSLLIYSPRFEDYLEAIETDLITGDADEKKLRIRAWRTFNNRFRKPEGDSNIEWTTEARANAKALISLLRTTVEPELGNPSNEEPLRKLMKDKQLSECLQRAEILRELGRFDESLKQLEVPELPKGYGYADSIRVWSQNQNPNLFSEKLD